jgi:alpha-N-acetylglucosamine transferase
MARGYVYSMVALTLASFQYSLLFQTSDLLYPSIRSSSIFLESQLYSYAYGSSPTINNSHNVVPSKKNNNNNSAPYAYAFVIGGCDPERPRYRNFIYDILISSYILHQQGSKAHVVAFFQMSFHSNATTLPAQDVRLLTAMQVKIKYIPVFRDESFYRIMLDKFRILSLTAYRRVLFLDGDVIPLTNLDYLFQLPDPDDTTTPTLLRENVVVAGTQEPANGGFFMLAPHDQALAQVNRIIQNREERARNSSSNPQNKNNFFDPVQGWGHVIDDPAMNTNMNMNNTTTSTRSTTFKKSNVDVGWVTNGKKAGKNWTFWAAFADQGLLYHYTKYVRKSVTIILADRVENWGTNTDTDTVGTDANVNANDTVLVRLQETLKFPFQNYSSQANNNKMASHKCLRWTRGKGCPPPYSDYFHFSGSGKPWFRGPPPDLSNETKTASAEHVWWYTLTILNDQLGMGIEDQLRNWTTGVDHHRPLLGMHPSQFQAKSARTNLEEIMNTTDYIPVASLHKVNSK